MDCKQDQMVWTGWIIIFIIIIVERPLDVRGGPSGSRRRIEGPRGRLGVSKGSRGLHRCPMGLRRRLRGPMESSGTSGVNEGVLGVPGVSEDDKGVPGGQGGRLGFLGGQGGGREV